MSNRDTRPERRVFRDLTDASVFEFLSSLNTPRALTVWLLYKGGKSEHDQLTQLVARPLDYRSPDEFRDAYAATSLLAKATFLRTSFDRKAVGLAKFRDAEEQCRRTNLLVRDFAPTGRFPLEALHPTLSVVRRKISRILGRFDPEELLNRSDWGPGVSTRLKGPHSVGPNKYQSETGMTQEVHDTIWPLLSVAYPSWYAEILSKTRPTVEGGNVVITVPKNSKTERVIAVEPGWNLWFQKGLGSMIRSRLLRFGCNLNDQSKNEEMSRLAYRLGLATIDFSSASDTIARETVRMLLPPEWYRVLDLFRCKFGQLPDGTRLYWEKFSSMGNGFTFELESLIFFALAQAVVEVSDGPSRPFISVFGDDVILPAEASAEFSKLSGILGFTVSPTKSFTSGPFRESCGAHWFEGADVKPFYVEDRVNTVSKCYNLHNNIVEFAHRCRSGLGLDHRFKRVTRNLRSAVDPGDFNLVPRHMGDVGFFSNLDHAMALKTTRFIRMVGYKIRIRTERAVTLPFDGYGLILTRLRGASDPSGGDVVLRPSADLADWLTSRLVAWVDRQHFQRAKSLKNDVPLKSKTKVGTAYPVVCYGQWYNFGGWF